MALHGGLSQTWVSVLLFICCMDVINLYMLRSSAWNTCSNVFVPQATRPTGVLSRLTINRQTYSRQSTTVKVWQGALSRSLWGTQILLCEVVIGKRIMGPTAGPETTPICWQGCTNHIKGIIWRVYLKVYIYLQLQSRTGYHWWLCFSVMPWYHIIIYLVLYRYIVPRNMHIVTNDIHDEQIVEAKHRMIQT